MKKKKTLLYSETVEENPAKRNWFMKGRGGRGMKVAYIDYTSGKPRPKPIVKIYINGEPFN